MSKPKYKLDLSYLTPTPSLDFQIIVGEGTESIMIRFFKPLDNDQVDFFVQLALHNVIVINSGFEFITISSGNYPVISLAEAISTNLETYNFKVDRIFISANFEQQNIQSFILARSCS